MPEVKIAAAVIKSNGSGSHKVKLSQQFHRRAAAFSERSKAQTARGTSVMMMIKSMAPVKGEHTACTNTPTSTQHPVDTRQHPLLSSDTAKVSDQHRSMGRRLTVWVQRVDSVTVVPERNVVRARMNVTMSAVKDKTGKKRQITKSEQSDGAQS